MWADKENYTKIVIHPDMLSDHMPDRVMKALATVAIGVQGDCSLQDVSMKMGECMFWIKAYLLFSI